ncbi:MMPL family RND transporter, partial [Mycobacteroides abscessus subsp. massiliense]
LDGIDELVDALQTVTGSLNKLDALQPRLVDLIPPQIEIQEKNRDLTQSNYAINNGTNTQNAESTRTATELGKAFDDAKNDDSFYLPPEAFDNPAFK